MEITYINPTIEFLRALFVIFIRVQDPSAQTIDNNDFYLCTKPSFSWSCFHCPSFVCAHPVSQFIIRCLLLKLPSKTFRPSIKVFVKDHYLDCVLTFIQLLRIQKTPSQYFYWNEAINNNINNMDFHSHKALFFSRCPRLKCTKYCAIILKINFFSGRKMCKGNSYSKRWWFCSSS